MCKIQFDMQVTGSQMNFTSDIPKFYFVPVSVAKISSERFLEKVTFETYQVKTFVYDYNFASRIKPDRAFFAEAFLR